MGNGVQVGAGTSGSLFTVPESDWTALSKRVGLTRLASSIAPVIEKYIPDFPQLVTVCENWANTTFPGLVDVSGRINTFSQECVQRFGAVQQAIAGLGQNDPIPPATVTLIQNSFASLAVDAGPLNSTVVDLSGQVKAFVDRNDIIDAEIANYAKELGPNWQAIGAATAPVQQAAGLVEGAWGAIATDFTAIATQKFEITMPFLLSLDVQSAVLSWTNVGKEAAAFQPMAAGQQQFLTGAWLTSALARR